MFSTTLCLSRVKLCAIFVVTEVVLFKKNTTSSIFQESMNFLHKHNFSRLYDLARELSRTQPKLEGKVAWKKKQDLYVVKDSGACLFGCARLSHCGSCCGPPTAFPCGHPCTVGALVGNHRCALMPRVASKQSANPFCGCWSVVWSMSLVYASNVTAPFCSCTCYVFDNNS